MFARNQPFGRGVLAALVLLALGTGVRAAPVTLRYGHAQGDVLRYTLVLDTPSLQASQKLTVTVVRDVVGAAPDALQINTALSDGRMTANNVAYPFTMTGQILSTGMDRRGVVTSTTVTGNLARLFDAVGVSTADSSADIFRSLGVLEFPVAGVDVGDSWSVTKSHTFANGDQLDITYQYTFQTVETVGGFSCARIFIEARPLMNLFQDLPAARHSMQIAGRLTITGTLWFAIAEGRIVKLDETIATSGIAVVVDYQGQTGVVPVYQKTFVALDLQ